MKKMRIVMPGEVVKRITAVGNRILEVLFRCFASVSSQWVEHRQTQGDYSLLKRSPFLFEMYMCRLEFLLGDLTFCSVRGVLLLL